MAAIAPVPLVAPEPLIAPVTPSIVETFENREKVELAILQNTLVPKRFINSDIEYLITTAYLVKGYYIQEITEDSGIPVEEIASVCKKKSYKRHQFGLKLRTAFETKYINRIIANGNTKEEAILELNKSRAHIIFPQNKKIREYIKNHETNKYLRDLTSTELKEAEKMQSYTTKIKQHYGEIKEKAKAELQANRNRTRVKPVSYEPWLTEKERKIKEEEIVKSNLGTLTSVEKEISEILRRKAKEVEDKYST